MFFFQWEVTTFSFSHTPPSLSSSPSHAFLLLSSLPVPVWPFSLSLLISFSFTSDFHLKRWETAFGDVRMRRWQTAHLSCCRTSNKSPSHILCEKWNYLDGQVESTAGSMWELERLMFDAQVSDLYFYLKTPVDMLIFCFWALGLPWTEESGGHGTY